MVNNYDAIKEVLDAHIFRVKQNRAISKSKEIKQEYHKEASRVPFCICYISVTYPNWNKTQ